MDDEANGGNTEDDESNGGNTEDDDVDSEAPSENGDSPFSIALVFISEVPMSMSISLSIGTASRVSLDDATIVSVTEGDILDNQIDDTSVTVGLSSGTDDGS